MNYRITQIKGLKEERGGEKERSRGRKEGRKLKKIKKLLGSECSVITFLCFIVCLNKKGSVKVFLRYDLVRTSFFGGQKRMERFCRPPEA